MLHIVIWIIVIFSSQFAAAQNSESVSDDETSNQRWYQVELLVYSNDQETAGDTELWEQQPDLQYPPNSVLLTDPSEKTAADGLPSSLDTKTLQSPIINSVELEEAAFTLLPTEELKLLSAARKIAYQRDFRILFHGAWRQFISERDKAESIIITGGDKFDNHYELEGTIKLGVERYLHIETDLWLNTFTSNIGLLETPWQLLPQRPSSESFSTTFRENHADDPNQLYSTAGHSSSLPKPSAAQKRISEADLIELFGSRFSVERTVTLRQKRRMRSDELHYLDHPLMGLIVKITQHERMVFPEDSAAEQSDILADFNTETSTEINTNDGGATSPAAGSTPTTKDSLPLQEPFEP